MCTGVSSLSLYVLSAPTFGACLCNVQSWVSGIVASHLVIRRMGHNGPVENYVLVESLPSSPFFDLRDRCSSGLPIPLLTKGRLEGVESLGQ